MGMRPKTFKFAVAEHKEFGGLGFRPKWYPNGDPLPGMAVAHDILEHFPNDAGEIEGEMMALGAAYFIRGDGGFWDMTGNVNPPEKHLAGEFPMIWDFTTGRDGRTFVKEPKPTRVMPIFREIVRLGVKDMRENGREESGLPDAIARERMAKWMTIGYRKAKKRYKTDAYSLAYLFKKIMDAADRELRGAAEGMELTVAVDFASLDAEMWCDFPGEEEES